MTKFLVCWTIATAICAVTAVGDNMIGPGRWFVLSIRLCDNPDQYEYQFAVQKKKLTRDQDCYHANMSLKNPIDEEFAIRIDLCKHVDGGCKPYQVLSDDSFIRFVKKYAEDNVRKALEMAGVDPPDFPLKTGEYEIKNYVFDYCDLPTDAVYGAYGAEAYLIKDQKEVGCVHFDVEFKEKDGECDGDDK